MKPRRAKPGSVFKLTYATIFDVVALPGGNEVLCARDADQPETVGMLERWNITTGERLAVFQGHTNTARAVTLAFDNTRVVSAGDDNTVRLWDLERASCLQVFSISARTLAVTDDSTRAIVADEERLSLVDLESGRQLMTFRGRGRLSWRRRGRAVSASFDETLRVWDVATGEGLRMIGEPRESGLCPPDKTLW